MRRRHIHFTFTLFLTLLTQSGFAQTLLFTSGMDAPGLSGQKLAAFTLAAENGNGKFAFIAVLERASDRYVLYVQDQNGLRPAVVSGNRIGNLVIGSIYALRMTEDGSIYFLARSQSGETTAIGRVTARGVPEVLYSSDPLAPEIPGKIPGKKVIEILAFDVNQSGEVAFEAHTYSYGIASLDIFYLSDGRAEDILTPRMISGSLPGCIGFQHPLIANGSVYAGAYRKSGPLGLMAPLALVEKNLTGIRVLAQEGDPAPSGSFFRSSPGAHGFKPLSSTPDTIYFAANSEDNLELHSLTAKGIQRIQLSPIVNFNRKISAISAVSDASGLVVLGIIQEGVGVGPRRAILRGPDYRQLLTESDNLAGRVIGTIFNVAASSHHIYATVKFDDKIGGEGLLQFAR